jgi:hypothetical protein
MLFRIIKSLLVGIGGIGLILVVLSYKGSLNPPQEPNLKNELSVSTLQGSNRIIITLPVKAEKNVRLHILDMLGRELKDTTYLKLAIPGELTLDIGHLHDGLYFLKVNYGSYQWAKKIMR